MKKSHYIFIGDIENYIKDGSTIKKKQLKRLLDQSETYFDVELPVEHPKGSSTFMAFANLNLAFSYLLTKDKRYLNEAKRWMFKVCSYEKWGHAHLVNVDLSASWNLFGLAISYDWLEEELTEDEKKTILSKLALQAKVLFDWANDNNTSGWVVHYLQNHNWINFTGLAAAGYVLSKPEYTKMAFDDFTEVFSYLNDDGSDYEGVVYWRYGAMWLFLYAHLLKSETEIDFFKKSEFLRNTFYYRLYQSAPDLSRQVNFGDTHDLHSGHVPTIYRLVAKEYKDEYAQYYASYVLDNFFEEERDNSKVKPGITAEAFLEYIFYDPTVAEKSIKELPTFKMFDDLGLLTTRSSWEKDAKVFSYKCGYPGGKKQWLDLGKLKEKNGIEYRGLSHNHPDFLSYVIINGDNYLTSEDGYNRKIQSSHHSSLLVDNTLCDVMGGNDVYIDSYSLREKEDNPTKLEDYCGVISDLKIEKNILSFKSEAHNLYPRSLKMNEVSRFVVTDSKSFIVFVDIFDSDKEHIFSTQCNTDEGAQKLKTDGCLKYDFWNTNVQYYVKNNSADTSLKTVVSDLCVTCVMTTQEPDKLCCANIKSLKHETDKPCKKARIFEVFTFGSEVKVAFDDDSVTVGRYVIKDGSIEIRK
jgi:hypothetical protein